MRLNDYSLMLYTLLCLLGNVITSIEWYVISRNEYLRENMSLFSDVAATLILTLLLNPGAVGLTDIVTKLCKHFYTLKRVYYMTIIVRDHKNVKINNKVFSELSVLQHNRTCDYDFLTVASFQA